MDSLESDLNNELAAIEEEDDTFYEEIEAPKFVDFTVPDRSRPDDRSWFCVRVGCDQQHEDIDPDALYKSFVLRVMAARSPNVRLRRALNRQALRSKSPQSAPAKTVNNKISRFSTVTSIPEKIVKQNRIKEHPISSLRSTPNHTKAKVQQPLTSNRKALTTPRSQKGTSNQDQFRSVKCQKAPVAGTKNTSVAKALFLHTPKKTAEASNLSTSEVCDGMKNLNLGSVKKHTSGGRFCKLFRCAACDPNPSEIGSKKGEENSVSSKKKIEGCLLHGINNRSAGHSILGTNVEECLSSSLVPIAESAQSSMADSTGTNDSKVPNNFEKGLAKDNVAALQALDSSGNETGIVNKVANSDDNKENDSSNMNSSNTNSECGSLQLETCDNISPKAKIAPGKIIQRHCTQGGAKPKRTTTNVKPFRLRTDERGILKEANLEKKIQQAQCGDGKQQIGKNSHGHDHQTGSDKEGKKTESNKVKTPRAKLARFVESRYATSNHKYQKTENNKDTEESKNTTIVKAKTLRPQPIRTQSVTGARKVPVAQTREKGALKTFSRVKEAAPTDANGISSKSKKPATIKREALFNRLHESKSCTKRPEMAIS